MLPPPQGPGSVRFAFLLESVTRHPRIWRIGTNHNVQSVPPKPEVLCLRVRERSMLAIMAICPE